MMKICLMLALFVLPTKLKADEFKLKRMIESAYPEYKVEHIAKTSYANLYEIFINNQIIYCDDDFTFLIVAGRLVDLTSMKNITNVRQKELSAQLKSSISHLEFEEGGAFMERTPPAKPPLDNPNLRAKCMKEGYKVNTEKFKRCMAN